MIKLRRKGCVGALVAEVERGSRVFGCIEPGDRIVALNHRVPRDLVDFLMMQNQEELAVRVIKPSGEKKTVQVSKRPEESLGITFDKPVFDEMKSCENACLFCFVDQLPPGLRDSLYFKDDDYRLSFLQGNFITLNNLGRKDLHRIVGLKLQPLYVSLHSTDADIRDRIMGGSGSRRSLMFLKEIIGRGIETHLQIVLCPGINDGVLLKKTIEDCLNEYPASSLGVVPVSVTSKVTPRNRVRPLDAGEAEQAVRIVEEEQAVAMRQLGRRFCFASDELYLQAGIDFPPSEAYEEYPQLENGIGMARRFIDEIRECAEEGFTIADPERTALVTGRLGARVLEGAISEGGGEALRAISIVEVENRVFGPAVTVSGLLGGKEIADELARLKGVARVLIPLNALSEGRFIDGIFLKDMARGLDLEVCAVEAVGRELAAALSCCVED